MGGSSGGGGRTYKKNFRGRKGGRSDSPAPHHTKRRLLEGHMSWFRITVSLVGCRAVVFTNCVFFVVTIWE